MNGPIVLLTVVLASGSHAAGAPGIAQAEFARLKNDFFNRELAFIPGIGSEIGVKTCDATLGDLSRAGVRDHVAYLDSVEKNLTTLQSELNLLDPQDRIDYAIMLRMARSERRFLNSPGDFTTTFDEYFDPYTMIQVQLLNLSGASDAASGWRDIATRTGEVPAFLAQKQEALRRALAGGHVPDKRMIEQGGIEVAREAEKFFATDMVGEAQRRLDAQAFAALAPRLTAAAKAASEAYGRYADFLKAELLAKAVESFAIGEEEYSWRLRNNFGIDETPAQIHQKGLELAAKIRARMEVLARQIDPSKDLAGVMADLKADHPVDDKAMMARYVELADRARDFVIRERMFDLPPDYKLKITETPPGMRSTISMAAYNPAPPLEKGRNGAFLVTPTEGNERKLSMHSDARMASIVVHEAFPGHDLQYYEFQHGAEVSPVRYLPRINYARSLNVEGYALYAEELMRQHGFYTPKEELAQLGMQIWRAYRLVVDTGLHTGRMSFQAAVDTLAKQAFLALPIAEAEAYRYTTMPLQAITYMMGRLQIEGLKEKYKAILGPDYSEAQFHKDFLSFGPVPPAMIEPVLLDQARRRRAGAGS